MASGGESGEDQYSGIRDTAWRGAEAGARMAKAAARAGTGGAAGGAASGTAGGAAVKALLAAAGTALAPVIALLFVLLVVAVILLVLLMALVGGRAAAQGSSVPSAPTSVSAEGFLSAVDAVYQRAHDEGWHYGHSRTLPPCEDGNISCDRLPARALYDMGYTDQPTGGITCGNIEEWCLSHGFRKITERGELARGDIVYMAKASGDDPHVFVLAAYDPETDLCSKYDTGWEGRLREDQPYTGVPLNEWEGTGREFRFALRMTGETARLLPGGQETSPTSPADSAPEEGYGTYTTLDDHPVTASGPGGYIIYLASKYIGTPYVYGGGSLTEGIDCSHFVSAVLTEAGMWDGHWVHSNEWRYEGERVGSLAEARAGDILVYPGDPDGHVVIYDGAGHVYESTDGRGVIHERTPYMGVEPAYIRRIRGTGNVAAPAHAPGQGTGLSLFAQTYTTLDSRPVTASGPGGYAIYLASQYVGYPYVMGGDSLTEGIDCSHYVTRILTMAGLWDGHWVQSTYWKDEGLPVPGLELAQAGDVIVYDGHVALYDGRGYIYEAKGSAWGITHDRRADAKPIIAIRRMPGAGSASVCLNGVTASQVLVTREALSLLGEELGVPFAGTAAAAVSRLSDVTVRLLDRFGLTSSLGAEGIALMERAWAGRAVTTAVGEVQASYFWDPAYGDGERGLGVLANEGYAEYQARFFEVLAPIVKPYADRYGLCTSFVMGKCVLESGWIKGDRLAHYNNCFGMNVPGLSTYSRVVPPAWDAYRTEGVFMMTHEGGSTADRAKTYRSLNDGIEDFCAVMAECYPAVEQTDDPFEEMEITRHYTEDPDWVSECVGLVEKHGLRRYD